MVAQQYKIYNNIVYVAQGYYSYSAYIIFVKRKFVVIVINPQ